MPSLEPAHGFALLWPTDPLTIIHAGRQTDLRSGDMCIVDRSMPITFIGGSGWTATLLELGDRRIGARVDDRQRFVGATLDGGSDLAQVVKRLWMMLQDMGHLQLGRHEPGDDLVEARLIEILTDLAARLAAQVVDARVTSHDAATIERAQLLIAAHLSDPRFGVAELAARMRVSPRHLSSLFARVNTTTSQAILQARLNLACRMLTDPVNARRQISSIALACGFDDQSYFARCFRRGVGMTPRRYRENGPKV
jgi:AraC-like DNA-binding protein